MTFTAVVSLATLAGYVTPMSMSVLPHHVDMKVHAMIWWADTNALACQDTKDPIVKQILMSALAVPVRMGVSVPMGWESSNVSVCETQFF